MSFRLLVTATIFTLVSLIATTASASVVSQWNAVALEEVRKSKSLRNGPPIVARALAIVHTCMYDAWAAYDDVAIGTRLGSGLRRPLTEHNDANKTVAVSFAAYRCLRNLYPDLPGTSPSVRLNAALTAAVTTFGYSPADVNDMTISSPAGVGNLAAQAVIDFRANDGANQYGNADCPTGNVCPTIEVKKFDPVPCVAHEYRRPTPTDKNATVTINQLGDVSKHLGPLPCVGPGGAAGGPYSDYNDPASGYKNYVPRNPLMGFCNPLEPVCPQPDAFIPAPSLHSTAPWPHIYDLNHWQPLIFSTAAKQTFIGPYFHRVTPFALESAEQFDHLRHIEPDIFLNRREYKRAADEVLRESAALDADKKLIVEYWADGPESELPPGHWGLFAQFVSARDNNLDNNPINRDVKMFFAMHNASLDAGIVAWHMKRKYDGVRPITAIRHLYDGRKVLAFGGPGRPVETIDGEKWMPYNPGSNLTPPFPGYISGHSAFSAASAEVLRSFTGSDHFGFSTTIPANFGRVEPGIPAVATILTYETFTAAANEAALSRILGGIHFSEDNETGLALGRLIGRQAWEKAETYFNGTAGQ